MQNTAVGRRLRRGGAVVLVMAAMAATLGIANPALASPGSRHDDDKVLAGRVRFYVERETEYALGLAQRADPPLRLR